MRPATALLLVLASAGTATETLQERDSEIRSALPAPGQDISDAQRQRIEGVVARIVDTQEMLESAIGTRWPTLTQDQRQRMLVAFARRFRTLGASELESMREARIEYLPERTQGGLVLVPTRVRVRGNVNQVDYLMRETGSGWRIVDMVVDDVSIVDNYRRSFARVILRENVEFLIRRLEADVEEQR